MRMCLLVLAMLLLVAILAPQSALADVRFTGPCGNTWVFDSPIHVYAPPAQIWIVPPACPLPERFYWHNGHWKSRQLTVPYYVPGHLSKKPR